MINTNDWEEFKLDNLFTFTKGKCSNSDELEKGLNFVYVGAKKKHNGFMKFVSNSEKMISNGNTICFICQGAGSNGFSNYFFDKTIQTTSNILGYNPILNENIGLFLVSVLDLERPKWSFGRGRASKLKDTIIKLPSKNGQPDWNYMDNFMKKIILNEKKEIYNFLKKKDLLKIGSKKKKISLNLEKWKKFKLVNLFSITKTKNINKDDVKKGYKIHYITRTSFDNGVAKTTSRDYDIKKINKKDALIIGGESAICFFQPIDYITGNNITKLEPKNFKLNIWTGLFFKVIIDLESFRYSYSRAFNLQRIKNTTIKLPIKKNGKIDFNFMEEFLKNLRHSNINLNMELK